jgi:hypothetical protein
MQILVRKYTLPILIFRSGSVTGTSPKLSPNFGDCYTMIFMADRQVSLDFIFSAIFLNPVILAGSHEGNSSEDILKFQFVREVKTKNKCTFVYCTYSGNQRMYGTLR